MAFTHTLTHSLTYSVVHSVIHSCNLHCLWLEQCDMCSASDPTPSPMLTDSSTLLLPTLPTSPSPTSRGGQHLQRELKTIIKQNRNRRETVEKSRERSTDLTSSFSLHLQFCEPRCEVREERSRK